MTIDRYIYVVRPFENLKWRKPQTVFLLSFIIWLSTSISSSVCSVIVSLRLLVSCVLASPFLYQYGVIIHHDNQRQCALRTDDHLQVYFRVYTVTLYYFIPLTIIVISYTKLLYYVYSKENKIKPKSVGAEGSETNRADECVLRSVSLQRQSVVKWSKKRRAVTRMVAIVTLVFSVCWLPITLYIISANLFANKTALLYYFKIIANSCAYLNSAINPVLYAFLNRSFRTNCGSLFSEPACSLFCADDERNSQVQQRQMTKVPVSSTTLDRFSYQSTNRDSSTSTREKRKKKVLIIDQHQQRTAPNECTELDYDLLSKKGNYPTITENEVTPYPEQSLDLSGPLPTTHARTTSLWQSTILVFPMVMFMQNKYRF